LRNINISQPKLKIPRIIRKVVRGICFSQKKSRRVEQSVLRRNFMVINNQTKI